MTMSAVWDPYHILRVNLVTGDSTCALECGNRIPRMSQTAAHRGLGEALKKIAATHPLEMGDLEEHFYTVAPMILCGQCLQNPDIAVNDWLSLVESLNHCPLPEFDPLEGFDLDMDYCNSSSTKCYRPLSLYGVNTAYSIIDNISNGPLSRKQLEYWLGSLAPLMLCTRHQGQASDLLWEWLWDLEKMVKLVEEWERKTRERKRERRRKEREKRKKEKEEEEEKARELRELELTEQYRSQIDIPTETSERRLEMKKKEGKMRKKGRITTEGSNSNGNSGPTNCTATLMPALSPLSTEQASGSTVINPIPALPLLSTEQASGSTVTAQRLSAFDTPALLHPVSVSTPPLLTTKERSTNIDAPSVNPASSLFGPLYALTPPALCASGEEPPSSTPPPRFDGERNSGDSNTPSNFKTTPNPKISSAFSASSSTMRKPPLCFTTLPSGGPANADTLPTRLKEGSTDTNNPPWRPSTLLHTPALPNLFASPLAEEKGPAAAAAIPPAEPIIQPPTEMEESTIDNSTLPIAPLVLPPIPAISMTPTVPPLELADASTLLPTTEKSTANIDISPMESLTLPSTPVLPTVIASLPAEGEGIAPTVATIPVDLNIQPPASVLSGPFVPLPAGRDEPTTNKSTPSIALPTPSPSMPSKTLLRELTDAGISLPTTEKLTTNIDIPSAESVTPLTVPTPPTLFTSSPIEGEEPTTNNAIPPAELIVQPSTSTSSGTSTTLPPVEESAIDSSTASVALLILPLASTPPMPSATSPQEPTDAGISPPIIEKPTTSIDISPVELLPTPTPPMPPTPLPAEKEELSSPPPTEFPPIDEKPASTLPLAEPLPQKPTVKIAEHRQKKGKRRSRIRYWLGFFCLFKHGAED